MQFDTIFFLFIHLAGYIIGLGAVTVIDLHGFLGRNSGYWTQATIRTHKITKPLIWLGTFFATMGLTLFAYKTGFTLSIFVQLLIFCVLILNGVFLSFYVSPFLLKREKEGLDEELLPQRIQNMIFVSFLISFLGWWTNVILTSLLLLGGQL